MQVHPFLADAPDAGADCARTPPTSVPGGLPVVSASVARGVCLLATDGEEFCTLAPQVLACFLTCLLACLRACVLAC